MRDMMAALKLTVNETKTQVRQVPAETFDFLGYTFGLHWTQRRHLCQEYRSMPRRRDPITNAFSPPPRPDKLFGRHNDRGLGFDKREMLV
jgi:hypothetical protein